MRKTISLKKKGIRLSFRPCLGLTLFIAAMVGLALTKSSAAHSPSYSDWSAPQNLGALINSAFSDQQPAISKNGKSLYFTSNRPGGLGGFDMYVSQRANVHNPWGAPVNLGPIINTPFDEGNPAFSADGHLLFFQSKRPGGIGGIDLWVSRRNNKHDDFDWQPAVNLGSAVNSDLDDNGPSYFENDRNGESDESEESDDKGASQLYFGSSRLGGLGLADIYLSERTAAGCFGPPVLITELSSPMGENDPTVRHDGLEVFFQSSRTGSIGLSTDLWVATRESTHDAWSTPVNLGDIVNSPSAEQNPYLSSDNKTLFFTSDRLGGFGGTDLYMSTRSRLRRHGDDDDGDDH